MYLALCIFWLPILSPRRKAAQVPLSVPKVFFTRLAYPFSHGGIVLRIIQVPQMQSSFNESLERPEMQEGHHGAFAAPQVETVIPIRSQALAYPCFPNLLRRKIQRPPEVLIHCALITVGGIHLLEKVQLTCFFDILADGRNKP